MEVDQPSDQSEGTHSHLPDDSQEESDQQQSDKKQSADWKTEMGQSTGAFIDPNQSVGQFIKSYQSAEGAATVGQHGAAQHTELGHVVEQIQVDSDDSKGLHIKVTRAPVQPDDQEEEMGLAVAILELIGSQPHIVINPPTADTCGDTVAAQHGDQSLEFIDVPVEDKDKTQQIEQGNSSTCTTQPGDVNRQQQQPFPVILQMAANDGQQVEANTEAENGDGSEKASGQGEVTKETQVKEEGVKRKRGRCKGWKKKGGKEPKKEQTSKKKKTVKKKDDQASTSNDTQNKEKKVSAPKNFACTICSAAFNRKDNLKVHTRTKHNTEIQETGASRSKCLNPQCEKVFYHKTQMLKHMEEEHGLEVQKKEMEFKSLEDFKKWKVQEETKKFVFFSSYRGPAANKNGKDKHLYFKCQKDGPNRPHRRLGEPGRKTERRNKKGSVKSGLLCPARMICKINGKTGKLKLTYIYSHSHTITCSDTEHQPLPSPLKKDLMEKLALGMPVKQLYKDLRKVSQEHGSGSKTASSSSSVVPVHYVSQRSLELMKHKVEMTRRLHYEESTSIMLLVFKLKSTAYNPILLYKPHGGVAVVGDESLMHLPFAEDLSVLALQTEEQKKVLKHNSSKVIYVDTTHTNNPSDLKLISLVVPDSYQQGYVAHLIANRIDEHLLYYFIKAIKERCEGFEPSVIMTDEDNTGYGVFQAVFPGVTFLHLLSKWHVHRSWLKRMNRDIPNVSLRQEIYHCLVLMLEEKNINKFNDMASNFVNHYATKSQTFTEYFVELYRARSELWAMCYRNNPESKIDDAIFMANYHANLKSFFGQKRKSNKRIDSLVNILLDIDKDDSWKRVKKAFQDGHNDPEAEQSLTHHERGMLIPEDQVEEVWGQDTYWLVSSYEDKSIKHQVKKLINGCIDDNCYLKCLELSCFSLCHHLYECTCYDEANICQHVHRVHSIRVAQLPVPQFLHCTPAADLGAYVEIHYMDEEDTVGVATENIQTTEVAATITENIPNDTAASAQQVGSLQSRLQHLVNLLGSRQVDDILLNHVTGTVDQLITTCEAASSENVAVTQS